MTVTKERAMQMFDHDLDIMMDDLRGMQAHYQIAEWEAFIFLRKPDYPESYVVKYAAASDEFAKQIVELHRQPRASVAAELLKRRDAAASPVAATVDAETLNRLLDALPEIPSEEEAEAVLQAAGTSGKEVVNGFIEKLLRENLELKTKLNTARHYFCSCGGALTAEEYIEHYFEKGHDRGDPAFQSTQT